MNALNSSSPTVQESAIDVLAENGDGTHIGGLAILLGHEDAEIREEVVLALGGIGGADAIAAITTALFDPEQTVRETAREMLSLAEEE